MSTGPQPLVGIVTPVYNEEAYLAESIESVLAQTHQSWDLTIVDNCSTDGSLDIARWYAAREQRIHVRQNPTFLQPLANCNAAVRLIPPASKYCKVVFGDDRIFPECLERMVAVAERHPSVGVVGAYALEGDQVALTGLPTECTVVSGKEACRRHLLNREYVFGTQNSVLYRADLVRSHDPFYNESNSGADTEVCFALLGTSDFGFVHQVLTFTRVRPASINAAAQAMQTSLADFLRLLVAYGPTYLAEKELETSLDQHLTAYYRFLGKSLLMRRDRKFWEYHAAQLIMHGVGYNRTRVAGGLIATMWQAVLNPRPALAALARRWAA
jgi:glycosyltransferase involved in cell wall biosynthesis